MSPLPAWARSLGITLVLATLIALGVGWDDGIWFPLAIVGIAAFGFGTLFRLFPGGLDFALGTANGFAIYACVFAVISRSAFPDAPAAAALTAFLLPVLAFLGAVWHRRAELIRLVAREEGTEARHLTRIGWWVLRVAAVAVIALSLPVNRMGATGQGIAMVLSMALVAAFVARSVREVVRFLVDMALLLRDLGGRAAALAVPVAAYVSLFALIAIVFACFYRIADTLSMAPIFASSDGLIRLDFRAALYFSLVTVSAVGYGDIWPVDGGTRLLVGTEIVCGQLLLLFGFFEITRSRLSPEAEGAAAEPPGDDARKRDPVPDAAAGPPRSGPPSAAS